MFLCASERVCGYEALYIVKEEIINKNKKKKTKETIDKDICIHEENNKEREFFQIFLN